MWALPAQQGAAFAGLCHPNAPGLPSEVGMYRVSCKDVETCRAPGEEFLQFGLRLESTMRVAGIFQGPVRFALDCGYGNSFLGGWNSSCHGLQWKKEQNSFLVLGIPSELAKHLTIQDCGTQ